MMYSVMKKYNSQWRLYCKKFQNLNGRELPELSEAIKIN